MRVILYDKNPGTGFMQWCLKTSWLLGCLFQKFVGIVDDYHGVSSLVETEAWLKTKAPLTVIQYWGHGSSATCYLAGQAIPMSFWLSLKPLVRPNTLLWFRVCKFLQGAPGIYFSGILANGLGCTVAGHTRIIGLWQGGLYTRAPNSMANWSLNEGDESSWLREDFNPFNKHTIIFLRTSIPRGW